LSSKNMDQLEFRIYKIADPLAFFQSQSDPHSIRNPDPSITGKTVKEKLNGTQEDGVSWLRRTMRKVVSPENRKSMIEKFPWLRSKSKPKKTVHIEHDPYAPLNQKNLVETWIETIQQKEDAPSWRWDYKDVKLKVKERGVYLVEGISKEHNIKAYTAVIISDLAFLTKSTEEQVLVWAVDRMTGEPASGAQITISHGQDETMTGVTDAGGLFQFDRQESTDEENSYSHQPLIMVLRGADFSISDPYFYSGSWSDNLVYIYTDRPIYRPSQIVYFKGILRQKDKEKYRAMKGKEATITVRDTRGNEVYKTTVTTNETGSIHGEFSLSEEPPLGRYDLVAELDDNSYYFSFEVDEYKKPEYEVSVTTNHRSYTKGEVINATIQANYYYGEPVRNADVEYYIFRSRYWLPWWYWYDNVYSWYFEDEDGYDDWGYSRELVGEGTGELDDNGMLQIQYGTEDHGVDQDYQYTIQARVVDASRREITGSKRVVVSRGAYFIRTFTDKWVYRSDEEVALTFKTFDFEKNPVRADLKVTIEWRSESDVYESVASYDLATGETGEAAHIFLPEKAGQYRSLVLGIDEKGKKITDQDWFYVSDRFSRYASSSDGIQIIPDKNQYKAGDTAHVMVISPIENAHLLITTEGNGIYTQHTVSLEGNSSVIDLEIVEGMQPNCFVAVAMFYNDRYYNESKPIIVPPEQQFLNVSVETDKAHYLPGEEATFMITTTDYKNKGISAEISVGVVDEAIYALSPDATTDIKKFFYGKRWNNVGTYNSLYFSFYGYSSKVEKEKKPNTAVGALKGAKDFVEANVRKDFKDTAHWSPAIRTDASGKAVVRLTMPDNLTTWRTTVRAVTEETHVGSIVHKVITRKDLIVRLETPRFLTQKDEVSIGTIVHNYLENEKLCRVSFQTEGAEYTGVYDIPKSSAGVGDPIAISDHQIELTIPPNGEAAIEWRLSATQVGQARLTAEALTDEESDAMELTIPIYPRGIQEQISHSDDMKTDSETANFTVNIPETAIPSTRTLQISLSPSIAATALSGMDYLIGYPYGCVEQTMSRFLPTIVVSNALKGLNMPEPDWAKDIPKMTNKGLNRLYDFQHDSGGWGWWKNDDTSAYNTAYVMFGFYVAKKAGFQVDEWRFQNGVNCMENLIRESGKKSKTHYGTYGSRTTRSYLTYVYSLVQSDRKKVFDAYFNQKNLQQVDFVKEMKRVSEDTKDERMDFVTALNAMTLQHLGVTGEAQYLLSELTSQNDESLKVASWGGDSERGFSWYNNEIETTAAVLQALVHVDPESPMVSKAIRFLNLKRQGNRWRSTRDTAFIIYAFTEYLQKMQELNPDYDLEIFVNDKQVKQTRMTGGQINLGVDVLLDELPAGENHVTIKKRGKGSLYYSYRLDYFNADATETPQENGIRVNRTYYLLQKQNRGGEIVYIKRPFTGNAAFGDEIYVTIDVTPNADYDYVMVEDPIPAGCEVIKEDQYYNIVGENRVTDDYYCDWCWWYADRDIRDEKVTFFITRLDQGASSLSYILRAEKPGKYRAMPTQASLMYFPEVNGHGVEQNFNIYDLQR